MSFASESCQICVFFPRESDAVSVCDHTPIILFLTENHTFFTIYSKTEK